MNIHKVYGRISPYFRRRRRRLFVQLLHPAACESILDLGGWPTFWSGVEMTCSITLLNPGFPEDIARQHPGFIYLPRDGCCTGLQDQSYGIIFSNSAIEHVGTRDRQLKFAQEARRLGGKIWIQTPAREFFIEPHLIAPFIHWLPLSWQRRLIRHFTVWGWLTKPTPTQVEGFLREVRLITKAEMQQLFPDCEILVERFLGMPKSYIACRRGNPTAPLQDGLGRV